MEKLEKDHHMVLVDFKGFEYFFQTLRRSWRKIIFVDLNFFSVLFFRHCGECGERLFWLIFSFCIIFPDTAEKMEKDHREVKLQYYQLKEQHDELKDKMKFFTKESAVDFQEIEEALMIVKQRKEKGVQELDFLEKVEDEKQRGAWNLEFFVFSYIFCRILAKSCAGDCQAAQGERRPGARLPRNGGG